MRENTDQKNSKYGHLSRSGNVIIGDLHRSNRISMNFADEVKHIKTSFFECSLPIMFCGCIIENFQSTMDAEVSFIAPPSSFNADKPLALIDIPFCGKNEINLKIFMKKIHHFTK